MDKRVFTPSQQTIIDTIVYFLSIALYAAILGYWFDAPGWATFGFAVGLAKTQSNGAVVQRISKRLGA